MRLQHLGAGREPLESVHARQGPRGGLLARDHHAVRQAMAGRGGQDQQLLRHVGGDAKPADRIGQVVEDALEEGDVERLEPQLRQVVQVTCLEARLGRRVLSMLGQEPGLVDPKVADIEAEGPAGAEILGGERVRAAVARTVEHAAAPKALGIDAREQSGEARLRVVEDGRVLGVAEGRGRQPGLHLHVEMPRPELLPTPHQGRPRRRCPCRPTASGPGGGTASAGPGGASGSLSRPAHAAAGGFRRFMERPSAL